MSYALPNGVENLLLSGVSAINGTGNEKDNVLTGNKANNILKGKAGNDTLDGGSGANSLSGGSGYDIFRFTTELHTDKITDFNASQDHIQLENSVFGALTVEGVLAESQFLVGSQANDDDDFVIYNKTTGVLSYDADANGAGEAVEIAKMGTGLAMTHDNILVI